jgi:hypothetical protein
MGGLAKVHHGDTEVTEKKKTLSPQRHKGHKERKGRF